MINAAYSTTLQAAGGSGSYTWSIISGSLPTGLSLEPSSGIITGTPAVPGTYDFVVQVNDGISTASRSLSILLSPLY